jgi:ribosomal protein L7/L12
MPAPISDADLRRVREAIFAGRKIEAIRIYRECTGSGLAEAKEFVEALEAAMRQTDAEKFTAPAGSRGCLGAVLFLASLGALAGACA